MSDVPPPPTPPVQGPPAWGHAAAGGSSGAAGLPHAPTAIPSLVFGVLGVTVLPVIGSVVALVLGYQSANVARSQPDRYSDQLGQVGRILGWVGLALTLGGILLALLAFLLFFGGGYFFFG